MKISKEDVAHLAKLARLEVDDSLMDKLSEQVGRILQYIDKIKEVDISNAPLMSGAALQTNVFREDVAVPSPGPEVTLDNAPERDDNFYTVPKVVG